MTVSLKTCVLVSVSVSVTVSVTVAVPLSDRFRSTGIIVIFGAATFGCEVVVGVAAGAGIIVADGVAAGMKTLDADGACTIVGEGAAVVDAGAAG